MRTLSAQCGHGPHKSRQSVLWSLALDPQARSCPADLRHIVPLPARSGSRGFSPSQTAITGLWRVQRKGSTSCRVMPNPSLKLTRYGRHCKPGLSHSYYRLSPGLQYPPPRAA
jgi:hypothetical protein